MDISRLFFALGAGLLGTLLAIALISFPSWLPSRRQRAFNNLGGTLDIGVYVRIVLRWKLILLVAAGLLALSMILRML